MTRFVTAEPFPPGEYIAEELEGRGWTQEDLADITKLSRRQVINLITGKSGITPETAILLAQAFGQEPETWMHYQISFELARAAQSDREAARRAAIFNKIPVREVKRRGWIKDVEDTAALEAEVCKHLEIEKIADAPQMAVAARKGTEYGTESPAHVAWYFEVKHAARHVHAAKYNEQRFEKIVAELLKLAAFPEDARRVPRCLADVGIRLVLIQHLKGTRIDGVAQWLDDESPVIGLSLRYDRMDNFWFSLMHEMVHIKYRHKSGVDVDLGAGDWSSLAEMEQIANREAAAYLVDPEKLDSFINRHHRMFYTRDVVRFAQLRGVHPSLVVGQLKHRKELPQTHLHKLDAKVRHFILGQTYTNGWGDAPTQGEKTT